jgi:hypothetical protein
MDLFDISSEKSKLALFEYAAELFGESEELFLKVKGRSSEKCQYINQKDSVFDADYGDCFRISNSFCVFQNPNPIESIILSNGKVFNASNQSLLSLN